MEASLLGKLTAVLGLVPVDTNAGANTGIRVNMKGVKRALFIYAFGDSTAAVTDFTFNQHTAASAGTSKVISTANPYYHKVGGGGGAAPAVFTKVVPGAAASNFVPTVLASDPGIIVFEILAEDLDRDNDYQWASIDMIDSTAAKIGSCVVLCEHEFKPAYANSI